MVRKESGKYVNFHSFLEKYHDKIQEDDLYLGYYIHLVEDAFYRNLFHNKYRKSPRSMEDVKRLHVDYHILNSYVVTKYEIKNELEEVENLQSEVFHEIADFRVEEFLPLAIKEIKSIKKGKSCLQMEDYVWGRKE